jgi:predicted NAD-dependent protein-ADP-ribosyltransferase YbiA (DUF1768 family)
VLLRPKEVVADENRTSAVLTALQAKFEQNPDLKQVLIATGDAVLLRDERGAPPALCKELMELRKQFIRS